MNYLEMTIEVVNGTIDEVETTLLLEGVQEYMVDDPSIDQDMMDHLLPSEYYDKTEFEAREKRRPMVTIYFDADEENRIRAEELRQKFDSYGDIQISLHSDDEWKDRWKEFFKPTRISNRIIVGPSWEDIVSDREDDIIVRVDPGMAFGTGTHETTVLTVRNMEKYLKSGDLVLDVGCGTGILSIIASKMGARDALGIDIDEDAVRTAKENIEYNEVAHNVNAIVGDLTEGVEYQANIVVANLLTNLVMRLSPDVKRHLLPGGIYISSGILVDHEERVRVQLEELGFEILNTEYQGDWCSVAATVI